MEYIRYIQALIKEQKALGAVEGEVVSRYGHLPRIAPEAYNIYTFAPLTEEQLALVEQNIGREIPCQYRTFLTHVSNGMHIFNRCLNLYGLQGVLDRRGVFKAPLICQFQMFMSVLLMQIAIASFWELQL